MPHGALLNGEVHVWRVRSGRVRSRVTQISRNALRRRNSCAPNVFDFPHLRRRFVAGRGALRAILAEYLSVEPRQLTFSYSSHGKPSLADPLCDIQFNVSHSDDLMVAAICREWPIGVDIEKEDPRFHAMEIAVEVFLRKRKG